MFSREENNLLTQIGPDKPMGQVFRRFWIPALMASELPMRDGTPVRLKIMGEELAAFRDSDGRIGVVDAYCPHRGAPMFFGRNEEGGLRCIYHAWKFDAEGTCVDIPSCPEGDSFRSKVKITAYPALERGGLIWIYMGPKEKQPPMPAFPWLDLPDSHRYLMKYQLHCNYLQALEGDFDPGHFYLHWTLDQNRGNRALELFQNRSLATYYGTTHFVEDTPWGVMYANSAGDPAEKTLRVFINSLLLPFHTTSGVAGPGIYSSNIRVPIDDEHTWLLRLRWSDKPLPEKELNEARYGGFTYPEVIPGTFIPKANKDNDYLIDRNLQRTYSVSGIDSFPLQDLCVQENQWGPIADRSREHLQSTDEVIIRVRRRLLALARDLMAGKEPDEPHNPQAFQARLMNRIVSRSDSIEATLADLRRQLLDYLTPARAA